ncbi:MAG TPA: metal ABC transporter permease [Acidimicrobiales bacterium]|nr:metal ABC transporter permease [Acidimicrobiales bacterium]
MTLVLLAPWTAIAHMVSHAFVRDALLAGSAVAVASGLVGYFVTLRGQVFVGDALSHVAFTGSLAALLVGADLRIGLFGSCIVFGLVMAALGVKGRPDDTVVGAVFAWILGLGALFLTLYTTSRAGADATGGVNVLFGSIFGLSSAQAQAAAVIAVLVIATVVILRRPLLFASIDEAVAEARGVPVRALGFAFLAVVGITAAEATEAVGALLLLGLLAAPAATAHRLTTRPPVAMWLSAALALGSTWAGLALAYAAPQVPPSFGIVAVATGCYLASVLATAGRRSGIVVR